MIDIYEAPDAYICNRCGHILEPGETALSYDDVLTCKLCGSDFVSAAYRCEICEEIVSENDIEGYEHKVCRSCIEKKRYDLDFCMKVADDTQTECSLNGFLTDFFTESEINELMLAALKERAKIKLVDGLPHLVALGGDAADLLVKEKENG